jgi:hypothetical protein
LRFTVTFSPRQGFVEVVIKRLESILLDELINLQSKDLVEFFADSKVIYDPSSGKIEKVGRSLKVGDVVNEKNGRETLTIIGFIYESSLNKDDLVEGMDYDIEVPRERRIRKFRLAVKVKAYEWYRFIAYEEGVREITGEFDELPPIYAAGRGRIEPSAISVEVKGKGATVLAFDAVADEQYNLDVSKSHVIFALG